MISAIIADEAAIGMVNSKTTAVRLIPAIGKGVGEELSFGGLLGGGPVMPLNTWSPAGLFPAGTYSAPIQSLKTDKISSFWRLIFNKQDTCKG